MVGGRGTLNWLSGSLTPPPLPSSLQLSLLIWCKESQILGFLAICWPANTAVSHCNIPKILWPIDNSTIIGFLSDLVLRQDWLEIETGIGVGVHLDVIVDGGADVDIDVNADKDLDADVDKDFDFLLILMPMLTNILSLLLILKLIFTKILSFLSAAAASISSSGRAVLQSTRTVGENLRKYEEWAAK